MEPLSVVLLHTGFHWPEVVYIGAHEECQKFILNTLLPALEDEGDEAIYYETTQVVNVSDALAFRRQELGVDS